MMFNGVGLAGVVVQLGVLALLSHGLGLSIALATALAVEAAILHNFLWHQRWTWRDRPSSGPRETAARLLRFNAVNGLVSLVGNVAMTVMLTHAGVHAVVANIVSIVVCSLLNFTAGERLVFRRPMLVPLVASPPLQTRATKVCHGWIQLGSATNSIQKHATFY
jgi:putative flippase GtrA